MLDKRIMTQTGTHNIKTADGAEYIESHVGLSLSSSFFDFFDVM